MSSHCALGCGEGEGEGEGEGRGGEGDVLELQHAAIHGSSGAQNSLAARSRAPTHQAWTEHASELLSAGAGLMSWDLACASAVVSPRPARS